MKAIFIYFFLYYSFSFKNKSLLKNRVTAALACLQATASHFATHRHHLCSTTSMSFRLPEQTNITQQRRPEITGKGVCGIYSEK